MVDFFKNLFATDGFPPRWFCGSWPESLGWLHIFSDITIFIAYTAIPLTISYFIFKRKTFGFHPILWLFVAFILLCGITHLVEASMFWQPWYRFSGLMKFLTAVVSVGTALTLIHLIPYLMNIPEARDRLESFINAVPTAMAIVDKHRRIVFLNTEFALMFGYSQKEIEGELIFKLINKDDWMDIESLFRILIDGEGNQPKSYREILCRDIEVVKSGGEIVPAQFCANWIEEGEHNEIIVTVSDRRYQQELFNKINDLEKKNAKLQEFARIISHDLKEPIRGIKNYSNAILEDQLVQAEGETYIASVSSIAEKLLKMVEDLLEYSSSSLKDMNVDNVDTKSIIDNVLVLLETSIKNKKAKIQIEPCLSGAYFDKSRLMQVFYNLISNALKYNQNPEPYVFISSRLVEAGKVVEYCVQDNGIGIDATKKKDVFKIFKRVHKKDFNVEGSGVGLSLTKKIIEDAGGNIWFDSIPGKGTKFYFTVPASISESDPAVAEGVVQP